MVARKLLMLMMVGAGVGGGAAVYQGIEPNGELMGGALRGFAQREPAAEPEDWRFRAEGTIKVGSFCVERVTAAKLRDPQLAELLTEIVWRFDVLALQGIQSEIQEWLPGVVDGLNARGRQFDYVLGPRAGREHKQRYAFVFDTESVEIDRSAIYSVEDPDDLLTWEPLVAAFRAKRVAADEAFTFTLVNVRVSREEAKRELDLLAEVYRAVRDDGRDEDDVILLGALFAGEESWGALGGVAGLQGAIAGRATNVAGTEVWDNVLFARHATQEFRDGSGVIDLRSELRLGDRELLELSEHLPVWAEFGVVEAGRPAGFAAR